MNSISQGHTLSHGAQRSLRQLKKWPSLDQAVLDAIGEQYLVVGTGEIDNEKGKFLRSLPNTRVGIAMRAKQLESKKCRDALKSPEHYAAEARHISDTGKATPKAKRRAMKKALEGVNGEWLDNVGGYVEIESASGWISGQRVTEITGMSIKGMVKKGAATCSLLWLANRSDLEASDREVHVIHDSIYLDRNISLGLESETGEDGSGLYFGDADPEVTRAENRNHSPAKTEHSSTVERETVTL